MRGVTLALVLVALPARATADVIHVYSRGETFAGIAERYYGSPSLEPVIVAANFLYVQANPNLVTGTHLVIPSVGYHRVSVGETWERLALAHLGDRIRGPYLARINRGAFNIAPSTGEVIRLPYLLRYVITAEEPLFEIARRFYGDRAQVQFILEFNHLASQRLTRGQTLVLPLPDAVLREQVAGSPEAELVGSHAVQRQVERELPTLRQCVARGLYVEAVALGHRLAAAADLTIEQRVAIHRSLAEAHSALERPDLATESYRNVISADPAFALDPSLASPRLLGALQHARGTAPTVILRLAPPTARPDSAH